MFKITLKNIKPFKIVVNGLSVLNTMTVVVNHTTSKIITFIKEKLRISSTIKLQDTKLILSNLKTKERNIVEIKDRNNIIANFKSKEKVISEIKDGLTKIDTNIKSKEKVNIVFSDTNKIECDLRMASFRKLFEIDDLKLEDIYDWTMAELWEKTI